MIIRIKTIIIIVLVLTYFLLFLTIVFTLQPVSIILHRLTLVSAFLLSSILFLLLAFFSTSLSNKNYLVLFILIHYAFAILSLFNTFFGVPMLLDISDNVLPAIRTWSFVNIYDKFGYIITLDVEPRSDFFADYFLYYVLYKITGARIQFIAFAVIPLLFAIIWSTVVICIYKLILGKTKGPSLTINLLLALLLGSSTLTIFNRQILYEAITAHVSILLIIYILSAKVLVTKELFLKDVVTFLLLVTGLMLSEITLSMLTIILSISTIFLTRGLLKRNKKSSYNVLMIAVLILVASRLSVYHTGRYLGLYIKTGIEVLSETLTTNYVDIWNTQTLGKILESSILYGYSNALDTFIDLIATYSYIITLVVPYVFLVFRLLFQAKTLIWEAKVGFLIIILTWALTFVLRSFTYSSILPRLDVTIAFWLHYLNIYIVVLSSFFLSQKSPQSRRFVTTMKIWKSFSIVSIFVFLMASVFSPLAYAKGSVKSVGDYEGSYNHGMYNIITTTLCDYLRKYTSPTTNIIIDYTVFPMLWHELWLKILFNVHNYYSQEGHKKLEVYFQLNSLYDDGLIYSLTMINNNLVIHSMKFKSGRELWSALKLAVPIYDKV